MKRTQSKAARNVVKINMIFLSEKLLIQNLNNYQHWMTLTYTYSK